MSETDNILKKWKDDPNHQGVHTCYGRCALIKRLETAEAERDQLKAELENFRNGKVYQEGLKDGEAHVSFQLIVDRDFWRTMAGRLAEELRHYSGKRDADNILSTYDEARKERT